jgi:hypothetical protein
MLLVSRAMPQLLRGHSARRALAAMVFVGVAAGCAGDGRQPAPYEAGPSFPVFQLPSTDGPSRPLDTAENQGGGGGGASLDRLACLELTRRAAATVTAAATSVVQCQVDADCVRLNVDSPCWRKCDTASLAGNQDTRDAVAAKAAEVVQICEAHSRGYCDAPGGFLENCHGSDVVGSSFTCALGRCVYADPATCHELSQAAYATLRTAARSVDQCLVDADCERIDVPALCWDCVGSIAGNQDTREAIAAQSATAAAICDRFTRAGCVVVPSGCPPRPPGATVCEGRKCVLR